jgi:hypothetical protein
VHAECHDAWRLATAPKCPVCGKGVVGTFYDVGGGVKVHGEGGCYAEYKRPRPQPPTQPEHGAKHVAKRKKEKVLKEGRRRKWK